MDIVYLSLLGVIVVISLISLDKIISIQSYLHTIDRRSGRK